MSALSLAQSHSRQDQIERESLRSHYQAKAPPSEPLAAPTPTRAPVTVSGPSANTWTPDMGIKFSGLSQPPPENVHNPAYPDTRPTQMTGQIRGGKWDPSHDIRFG
jgi:hypothetical protein